MELSLSNDCYTLVCGKKAHIHTLDCHSFGDCGKEHKHSDSCYSDVKICELSEHTHSDACKTLACEQTEHTEGEHTSECYKCSIEPHTHTDGCYSDWPNAAVSAQANTGWYIKSVTVNGEDKGVSGAGSYSTSLYMNQDYNVNVEFAKIQYNVTGKPNNSTMGFVEGGGPVDYNGSVTLEAIANRGYKFTGWDDGSTDNPREITGITSNKEYTAIFEALKEYKIETHTAGSGSGKVIIEVNQEGCSGPYYEGDCITIRAEADEGSYFVGWLESNEIEQINIDSLSSDIVLTAVFEQRPGLIIGFNQDASEPGKTNVWTIKNPAEFHVNYEYYINDNYSNTEFGELGPNETITITTAVEKNGDILTVWWCPQEYEFLAGDASVRATMFTWITANTTNGSIVDSSGRTLGSDETYYFAGTKVILTANPAPGYRFEDGSWTADPDDGNDVKVETSGNRADITISGYTPPMPIEDEYAVESVDNPPSWINGIVVGARFETIPSPPSEPARTYYTLDVSVEGPGSVVPASGSYVEGSRIMLTPSAGGGARFVGWFGENGSEVDAYNAIVMDGNKKLIARFEVIAPDEDAEADDEEEFTDETIPESGTINDVEEEEVVPDQDVPYDAPTLPQTGGIPMGLFIGTGATLMTAGLS